MNDSNEKTKAIIQHNLTHTTENDMYYTIKAQIYTGEESGFIAECIELPIVTQGETLDDVVKNLREAISLHLDGEDLAALGFAANPPIVVNYEMESVCA